MCSVRSRALVADAVGRAAVFAAAATVVAGCGGGDATPSTSRPAAPLPAARTTVYFLTHDGAAPVGVRRTIERRSPWARQALEALLAGPSAAERRRGIRTAIPDGTRLRSLRLVGRGPTVAVVDLAGLPRARAQNGDEATLAMRLRVITQVARTLIGVSGVDSVEIRNEGRPWDLWTRDGDIVRTATGYDRLRGWTPICGGRSAAERAARLSRCFSALP